MRNLPTGEEFKDAPPCMAPLLTGCHKELQTLGYKLCTNGTDNHIVLVNLRDKGITGSKIETFSGAIENLSYNNIFYDALRKIGTEFSLD